MTYAIWSVGVRCPACPDCKVQLLPQVTLESLSSAPMGSWHEGHGEFWCGVCKAEFVTKPPDGAAIGGVFTVDMALATIRTIRTAEMGSLRLRLELDGAVSLVTTGDLRLSRTEMRALSSASIWLGRAAQTRLEHLRGADRWIFSKDGDAHAVTHLEESRKLAPYTVGRAKGGTQCWACRRKIGVGAPAYKPIVRAWESSRVRWKDCRFCAACVETGGEAKVRGPLRVIAGGRGATG